MTAHPRNAIAQRVHRSAFSVGRSAFRSQRQRLSLFHRHFGLHRVRDKTIIVRRVMDLL